MTKLKFQKMWEAANTYVLDIEPGSALPILETVPKVISFADTEWLYYFENGIGAAYYSEVGISQAKTAGLRDFLRKDFQKSYFKGIEDALKAAQKLLVELEASNIQEIGNKELEEFISKTIKTNTDIFGYYLACQPQYIAGIEEKIEYDLSELVPEGRAREVFTILSTPTKDTTVRQEERDWLNLVISYKKNKNFSIDDAIQKHCKRYYTLHVADSGKAWTTDYLSLKLKEYEALSIETLDQKLDDFGSSLEKLKAEKEQIVESYKIPKEIVEICDVIAEIGHMRLEMRVVGWTPVQYHIELLARETAKRFDYDPEKIKFARTEEILGIFEGKEISKEMLDERSRCFLMVIHGGKLGISAGNMAREKFRDLVEESDLSATSEVKGNIAMKGVVRGTALVLKWTDDLNEKMKLLKEDTILVAGQTRPQLMPIISRSKAIVTDEGGITSHAAIVSRELRIPCIIGTKIATQVIRDGDMVEVDANKGVVTILNKK